MEWIIIIVVIIGVVILFGQKKAGRTKAIESKSYYTDHNPPKPAYMGEEVDDYYHSEYQKVISLYARKGYKKFPIVGMYYRDLSMSDLGKFKGRAEAQTDNEYDEFAVGIYSESGVHLGFIPGGNSEIHEYILGNLGSVEAYGYVAYSENNGYYGEVCIEIKEDIL